MDYMDKKQWLEESWGITIEDNEKNLKRLDNGEFKGVWIGCDTENIEIEGCSDIHEKYISRGYSGYVSTCRVCDKALRKTEVINIYVPKYGKICQYVNKSQAEKLLHEQQVIEDKKIAEKELAEKKRLEEYNTIKGNRTVVLIQRNLEYGTWRILGGEHGRLERDVFFAAKNQMNEAFKKALDKHDGTLLASKPQPESSKVFDLLTKDFAFKIVDDVFEE